MFHDIANGEITDFTLTFEVRISEDLLRVCSLESLRVASSLSVLRDDAGEPYKLGEKKKFIKV